MPVLPTRKPVKTDSKRTRTQHRRVSRGNFYWLDFHSATDADIRYLERKYKFHHLDIEDVRSSKQRPKLEEYPDYIFTIFHFPFYDRRARRLVQEEVDVFIGSDFLITIHSGRSKVISQLFEEVKLSQTLKEQYMGQGSGFLLYELISRLFENSFPMLDKIAERINIAEQQILAEKSKEMVEELSHLKLEIINFRRIIRPQRALVEALEAKKSRLLPAELDIYFDDVLDAIGRSSDLLENYKEVVESLEDTNESYIQHRTNNVVKMLTLISLITLPGASISGLLAMNLKYPFPVTTEITFFVALGISVAFAVILFSYMYLKRWL